MNRILALLVLCGVVTAAPAAAQTLEDYDYENLAFRGVGIDLGAVFPVRAERALGLGVRADLGLLGPNLRIVPSVAFWQSELERAEVNRFADQLVTICQRQPSALCPTGFDLGTVELTDVALNVDAHYEFETELVLTPYAGGGVGLHLLNGSGSLIQDTFVEDLFDGISPSLNLLGGAMFPLGEALQLYAEARYALLSETRHATLAIGGMWLFGAVSAARP